MNPNASLKDGFSPLMAAATSGHTDIVRDLLSSGADVDLRNNRGMTALMIAASMGRPHTGKALIAGGAVQYSYDSHGNLSSIIDQRGNTTTMVYDEVRYLI